MTMDYWDWVMDEDWVAFEIGTGHYRFFYKYHGGLQ